MSKEIIARYTDSAITRYDGRGNKQCPLCGVIVIESDIEEYYEVSSGRKIECCTDCREEFEFDNDVLLDSDIPTIKVFNLFWQFAHNKLRN